MQLEPWQQRKDIICRCCQVQLRRCKDNKQTLAGTLWRVAGVARVAGSIRTYLWGLGRATLRVNLVLQFQK